ncbi:MAG: S8 family serine peptidase [Polyangiaceae bacterium]|nr:S8 family serine peptidase [Polyangiaceae bacterium]
MCGWVGATGVLLGAVSGASAGEPTARPLGYHDGARRVEVERLGPAVRDAAGRRLTPVRLRYPSGHVVAAEIDRTAIVALEPGAVELEAGAAPRGRARDAVAAQGGRLVRPLMPSIGLWLAEEIGGEDGAALAARLDGPEARAAGVRQAQPNLYLRRKALAYTPTDPHYPAQWYFHNLGMPDAWDLGRGDAGTTVVVIDTGCDMVHPDLVAKLDPGLDVVAGDTDPTPDPGQSGAAHGTSCAGLVGAATDNGVGIAGGCPECRLRCVRLLADVAVPTSADVDAFQFVLDTDAAVASNSWGYVDPTPVPQPLADAIASVATNGRGGKGALVLFAAGNDDRVLGDDELEAAPGVWCIGAINNFDEATPFTNSGNALDVVAPTGTFTTDIAGPGGEEPGDYTSLFGGTSSACPVAAGVAGLLASAAPELTSDELYDIVIHTARPAPYAVPDANGHDLVYGFGILDPTAALRSALGLPPAGAGGGAPAEVAEDPVSGCHCALPGAARTAGERGGAAGLATLALGLGAWGRAGRRRRATTFG